MKPIKLIFLSSIIASMTSCASGYKMIQPAAINYLSADSTADITLEYKYNLLHKRYARKEEKKGIRLVAIKITNHSEEDAVLGKDLRLTYEDGTEIYVLDNEEVYKDLRQGTASYLFYLLLTPVNFYVTDPSGEVTSSTPVGLVLGPGLSIGNMVAAGAANKNFKEEMLEYNINGTFIGKGETKYGLIGIKSKAYDALRLRLHNKEALVLTEGKQ